MNKVYIGSTMCGLAKLEANHRNARELGYTMSKFRTALEGELAEGKFSWLIKPELRTQREVEKLEGMAISKYIPEYNKDYDPVASSIRYGRYETELAQKETFRGVYMFEMES